MRLKANRIGCLMCTEDGDMTGPWWVDRLGDGGQHAQNVPQRRPYDKGRSGLGVEKTLSVMANG